VETSNKQKAVSLVRMMATGDTGALSFIDAAGFVQHDLAIADGVASYERWLAQKPATAEIDVVRVFEDGDHVITHSLYDLGEPSAAFDIFRFKDGKAVEHWNNFQDFGQPNPSGHTLLDGPTEVTDLDRTDQNKEIVSDFLTTHLINDSDDIARFFDGDAYIQHNSVIPDGVSGLLAAGKAFREKGMRAEFTAIHKVLGQGNFILAVSEGHVGTNPISFYDLYRVADGQIAEHWDILEPIKPEDAWKNANGKF